MDDLFPIEINGGFHENSEQFSEDEFEAVWTFLICKFDFNQWGFFSAVVSS
jgi:hypothetical protein